MTVASGVEAGLWEALKDVEDPEFPISVVDMGLIVDLTLEEGHARVDLTLTSMGCPAIDMITDDIRARLLREDAVREVSVRVVWEPIWTKDRLTPDGRMALREWGISL